MSDALLEVLFNVYLGMPFLLLSIKTRTFRSGSVCANNPRRRRGQKAERSEGFWRRLLGG
jgi:hypothetical protein